MAFVDDYVGVHERIDKFLEKYPDGRIQTAIAHLSESLVVMQATVYRDAGDERPIVAHSQLGIPGKTNFTRDSEVENAETSAVGRALAFMGFETKKGIASREEVRSRQEPSDNHSAPSRAPREATGSADDWVRLTTDLMRKENVTSSDVKKVFGGKGFSKELMEQWLAEESSRTVEEIVELAVMGRK